jgi:hypothetical protein
MPESESPLPFIMAKIDEVREHTVANFRGNLIIQLATISLLIDAGITTKEAAIQKIQKIQHDLPPEKFRESAVMMRVNRAIELLRENVQQ